jgi:hypothetical protein
MKKGSEVLVGIDTAKANNAVAVAEAGRDGEVRYLGTFDNTPDAVAKLVRKLSSRYEKLYFCYEAGSTGTGCIGGSCCAMVQKWSFVIHTLVAESTSGSAHCDSR